MALNLCDQIADKKTCDDLSDNYESGKISAKAVIKIVKKKVKNKPKAKAELEEIEKLIKG